MTSNENHAFMEKEYIGTLELKVTKLFGEAMRSIITHLNSMSLWSGRVFGRFSAHEKCLETSEENSKQRSKEINQNTWIISNVITETKQTGYVITMLLKD